MNAKYNYETVIVGAGVSGLLSSYLLGRYTSSSIGLFEGGTDFNTRMKYAGTDASVHLCGIGGAGTLGGGKLCSIPSSGDIWIKTKRDIDYWQSFVDHLPLPFAAKSILAEASKNLYGLSSLAGNLVRKDYKTALLLRKEMAKFILELDFLVRQEGVSVHEEFLLAKIHKKNNTYLLQFTNRGEIVWVQCTNLIIATGRSSANYISTLLEHLPVSICNQSPDLGIRLEIPQMHSQLFSKFGKDTKIKTNTNGFNLRTFCVCSGGKATAIKIGSERYVDGHFGDELSDVSNIGIMSRTPSLIGYNSAIEYCKALSGHSETSMSLSDYIKYGHKLLHSDYSCKYSGLVDSIIHFISEQQRSGILESNIKDAIVTLPSIDRYWPLVKTRECFETHCNNLFVIGDAAGVSRGYIQSLWSGWCSSHEIISRINGVPKYCAVEPTDVLALYA